MARTGSSGDLTVYYTASGTATPGQQGSGGGTEIAVGSVSSSSADEADTNAIDGDTTTRWRCDWMTEGDPWIAFNFGGSYAVGEMKIANYQESYQANRGMRNVDIYVNQGGWVYLTSITLNKQVSKGDDIQPSDYAWADTIDLGGVVCSGVKINSGQSPATITVTPFDDSEVESDETVIVTLSANASYSIGSPSSATVTIGDDDDLPSVPLVTLSAGDALASETGPDSGAFTITRDDSTGALTVNYTVSGTASANDYSQTLSGSVVLSDGVSSVAVTITPVDDSSVEGTETVALTLSTSAAYQIGSPSNATVSIADSDVTSGEAPWSHGAVQVTSDGRFFEHADGTRCLWMNDTAWNMLAKASREEVDIYFADREAE